MECARFTPEKVYYFQKHNSLPLHSTEGSTGKIYYTSGRTGHQAHHTFAHAFDEPFHPFFLSSRDRFREHTSDSFNHSLQKNLKYVILKMLNKYNVSQPSQMLSLKETNSENLIVHPLFYLRFCYPSVYALISPR